MQIFSSLLFGVSASLDALILGISYGIRKVHIKLWQNLFISLITLSGTCLAIGFGRWQGVLLQNLLPGLSGGIPLERCIGSMVLMLFGLYYLFKFMLSLQKKYPKISTSKESAVDAGSDSQEGVYPHYLSLKASLLMGLALSVNNMGIGLGASIAGLSLLPAAVSTFLFSAVFLGLGNCLGKSRLSDFLGQAATPISGLLLLGLGLFEWFF
ncbi:MAG: manganese efflux pump [Lachnoclostridium sp.]|nr:manganese efflux pump [Lachnospira sp.]MCM1248046.1 manganese efflux pump [Lachnoclostridium sp.]